MPLRPFRSEPFRAIRAGAHSLLGWICYQIGAHDRARDRFERVLEIRGDDFTSYVFLGRLAYSDGDYAGWRRECELAQRTSPARFAKLRHPFDLHVPRSAPGSGTSFGDGGDRVSWRSFRAGRIGSRFCPSDQPSAAGESLFDVLNGVSPDSSAFDPTACDSSEPVPGEAPGGDDFATADEREHFRHLGPLSGHEIRAVDLDQLSRLLSE